MQTLRLQEITKSFGTVKALQNVSLSLQAGEVLALCGENGAGKSTLMNILAGALQPDSGQITIEGKEVKISNPNQAVSMGIAIVFQQLSLFDHLTVAENIFANQLPTRGAFIDKELLKNKTKELLQRLHISGLSADMRVSGLSAGQKQLVEIAKALAKNPQWLLLDEPTASLSEREAQTLFGLVRQLKTEGVGIIYISHRMAEIFTLADRITVLKDGTYQGTWAGAEISPDALIRKMVGRDILHTEHQNFVKKEVLLEIKNLTGNGFQAISFQLHRGEILGFAGLAGAGRTEIAKAIFGANPIVSGEIWVKNHEKIIRHPADAIAVGIGYVPEERKTLGLFLDRSIQDNIVAARLTEATKGRLFDRSMLTAIAQKFKEKLRIYTPNITQRVGNLSGGNQQKVVLAKWLLTDPDVLIVDEPTHGVDIGAKFELYEMLRDLARQGKGILLISDELTELIYLCDRALVIKNGRIAGEVTKEKMTEEELISLAY
jgi:ABC-type sugar transport system ATPase subunit